jgi:hypothetical protein
MVVYRCKRWNRGKCEEQKQKAKNWQVMHDDWINKINHKLMSTKID